MLIATMKTMRIGLAMVVQHMWKVYQMDMKSSFFNGVLKQEVYVGKKRKWID